MPRAAPGSRRRRRSKQLGPELARMFKVTHYNLTEGRSQMERCGAGCRAGGRIGAREVRQRFPRRRARFGPPQRVDGAVDRSMTSRSAVQSAARLGPDLGGDSITKDRPVFTTGGPHVISVERQRGRRSSAGWTMREFTSKTSPRICGFCSSKASAARASPKARAARSRRPSPRRTMSRSRRSAASSTEPISDLELGNRALAATIARSSWPMSARSPAPEADRLKQFVEQGGTLMIFMGDSIDREQLQQRSCSRGS